MQNLIKILLLTWFFGLASWAIFPSVEVKFENVIISQTKLTSINSDLLAYLEESPEVLRPIGKPYKADQYCAYVMDLDATNHLDVNTIKLDKSNKNYAFNLKIIEFIKGYELQIKKKNPQEPVKIKIQYLSF